MNKFLVRNILILLMLILTSCAYEAIYSEKNYSFEINEIVFTGENKINKIIKQKLKIIKNNNDDGKKAYSLLVNSDQKKTIVSKDSKGDTLKFEIIITTYYEITRNENFLFKGQIKKSNIYNNVSDKFKLEQNENIIIQNLSEKISEEIISSIINLNDN